MSIPENLKYTKEHEWIRVENGIGTVGITQFAADQLGDVVYVEFPEVGTEFGQGSPMASIESVKAVSDIYAPVAGKVVEINSGLEDNQDSVNKDPYIDGWMIKLELSSEDTSHLMSPTEYEKHTRE